MGGVPLRALRGSLESHFARIAYHTPLVSLVRKAHQIVVESLDPDATESAVPASFERFVGPRCATARRPATSSRARSTRRSPPCSTPSLRRPARASASTPTARGPARSSSAGSSPPRPAAPWRAIRWPPAWPPAGPHVRRVRDGDGDPPRHGLRPEPGALARPAAGSVRGFLSRQGPARPRADQGSLPALRMELRPSRPWSGGARPGRRRGRADLRSRCRPASLPQTSRRSCARCGKAAGTRLVVLAGSPGVFCDGAALPPASTRTGSFSPCCARSSARPVRSWRSSTDAALGRRAGAGGGGGPGAGDASRQLRLAGVAAGHDPGDRAAGVGSSRRDAARAPAGSGCRAAHGGAGAGLGSGGRAGRRSRGDTRAAGASLRARWIAVRLLR